MQVCNQRILSNYKLSTNLEKDNAVNNTYASASTNLLLALLQFRKNVTNRKTNDGAT